MADGRLKIGSSFLKIGANYLRIGPAPAADVFEYSDGDPLADGDILLLMVFLQEFDTPPLDPQDLTGSGGVTITSIGAELVFTDTQDVTGTEVETRVAFFEVEVVGAGQTLSTSGGGFIYGAGVHNAVSVEDSAQNEKIIPIPGQDNWAINITAADVTLAVWLDTHQVGGGDYPDETNGMTILTLPGDFGSWYKIAAQDEVNFVDINALDAGAAEFWNNAFIGTAAMSVNI